MLWRLPNCLGKLLILLDVVASEFLTYDKMHGLDLEQ